MNKLPKRIVVVGLGLIGGSIVMGLKKRLNGDVEIIGVTKNEEIPLNSDLIIIATPITEIIKVLNKLDKILVKKTLVIDVGSTKKLICDHAANLKNKNLIFVGTHPMGGREQSGLSNADPNLFVNKTWVVSRKSLLINRLIELLGGKPVIISPDKHDKLVAFASHLSLITSSLLLTCVNRQKDRKTILQIASTGFRDTTRLASFSPKIKAEIVSTNKNNLLNVLSDLKNEMQIIKSRIEKEEWRLIEKYFEEGKQTRDNWLAHYFS
ncbi:hypothetical protein A2960_02090 [Candidatus Gottesmanbacteria bacterium RIFCSPLOWO2_01_FULL_39_12b]|uniref:Prephenate/arogenate dehydrogenase domain-containing protein n=1 Tax=Candidatus Gottesmanbacteria bacterium RIFCSPLOWO2_01_FULL_39_12b TaxID=1798388 RepID=A0A1F6AQF0_9BACT|nr:MAG: hypothetical protein A2960_02090 [Candidatus Gottesmanbacteria bacterium RIFCSPLOWO2_01_FULL_39_12b]